MMVSWGSMLIWAVNELPPEPPSMVFKASGCNRLGKASWFLLFTLRGSVYSGLPPAWLTRTTNGGVETKEPGATINHHGSTTNVPLFRGNHQNHHGSTTVSTVSKLVHQHFNQETLRKQPCYLHVMGLRASQTGRPKRKASFASPLAFLGSNGGSKEGNHPEGRPPKQR